MSVFLLLLNIENNIIANIAKIKPGTREYISISIKLSQIIKVKKPTTIPAKTPFLVVFFHQRVRISAGPNAAPNAPHANSTLSKMEFGS